jgi:hypothetical protein
VTTYDVNQRSGHETSDNTKHYVAPTIDGSIVGGKILAGFLNVRERVYSAKIPASEVGPDDIRRLVDGVFLKNIHVFANPKLNPVLSDLLASLVHHYARMCAHEAVGIYHPVNARLRGAFVGVFNLVDEGEAHTMLLQLSTIVADDFVARNSAPLGCVAGSNPNLILTVDTLGRAVNSLLTKIEAMSTDIVQLTNAVQAYESRAVVARTTTVATSSPPRKRLKTEVSIFGGSAVAKTTSNGAEKGQAELLQPYLLRLSQNGSLTQESCAGLVLTGSTNEAQKVRNTMVYVKRCINELQDPASMWSKLVDETTAEQDRWAACTKITDAVSRAILTDEDAFLHKKNVGDKIVKKRNNKRLSVVALGARAGTVMRARLSSTTRNGSGLGVLAHFQPSKT